MDFSTPGTRNDLLFTMSDNTRPPCAGWHERRTREVGSITDEQNPGWWSQTGSNRRPPACKAGALPAELWPLQRTEDGEQTTESEIIPSSDVRHLSSELVGLGRFELPTSRLSSARSNQLSYRPRAHARKPAPCREAAGPMHDNASVGSSAKKEKRRRRCPA
jgi:hypothetical protein